MKRHFLVSIFILSALWVSAKNPKQPIAVPDTTVYTVVDKMPEFLGGSDSLISFIRQNARYTPYDDDIFGRVILTCIIEIDGSITHIQITRGLDPRWCDKEAIRIVNNMPKWSPGILKGKKVRTKTTIPVNFKLD